MLDGKIGSFHSPGNGVVSAMCHVSATAQGRIYRILQGRVSSPSERGTGGRSPKAPRGAVRSGKGAMPSPENFCISYLKMVSFYAFPDIFIVTVTALTTCFEHIFFKKGTVIKRARVRTPGHPPGSATADSRQLHNSRR